MQSFNKTPKQHEATNLQASHLHTMLYGGGRSGKTFITLRNIIIRACKTPSRHLITRLRFNHAKTAIWYDTAPKVFALCFPDLKVTANKSDWFWELPNGSQIWLGGLDDKDRVEKILGNEYSTIAPNECSQLSYDAIEILLTRLAEKTSLQNRMYYDCNPPSKKHWTYRLFIDKVNPIDGSPLNNPDKYASLLMNPKDNEQNIASNYIEDILGGMSKRKRDRFELGLFSSDTEGALWSYDMINEAQRALSESPAIKTVVGVDPAVTSNANSDMTGIIVASKLENGMYRVEADYSLRGTPAEWANAVKYAYHQHDANEVIAETNQGGDLVVQNIAIADNSIPVRKVHASKGKYARAEPIAHLYEKGEVEHCPGIDEMEDEIQEYVPHMSSESPNRLDALVWALTELSQGCNILISI